MIYQLIDGKKIADRVHAETRAAVDRLAARGAVPGLAVVLVGDDPASQSYVRAKGRKCGELGIYSETHKLPATIAPAAVLSLIARLNANPRVHGILVQSPLPPPHDERAVVATIDPAKDVDGFHPVNVAKMVRGDPGGFVPCTPAGCQRLLHDSGIPIAGARVVIVGRSMIVGKPLALLLMAKGANADATVTVAHSRTRDLAAVTREADILIAAIGRPQFIGADHVRAGAVVIDVGVNRVADPAAATGYRLVGDVDFAAVAPRCRAITPVPGGVGPMTIAMLMANTATACARQTA